MKFVCVECDEPMKFAESGGLAADGTLSVTFRCPSCDWGAIMLTNPQETQMVRGLGVKIGGGPVPAQPMEMLRQFVKGQPGAHPPLTAGDQASAAKCPFSQVVRDMTDEPLVKH